MKVFFTASQRGQGEYGAKYKKIAEALEQHGYKLLDDDILTDSSQSFYSRLEKGGHKTYEEFYKKKIRLIQEADLCVFESSTQSLSIGFVIEKALEFNKPVIVLFTEGNSPVFIQGTSEEKLILHSYTEENIASVLKKVLLEAESLRDKRFNFFISPKLLEYLERVSKKQEITKSTFIRGLILEHMKRHKNDGLDD
ncbi:hypothetical protein HY947_02385 [Candidatus Gottesmanbacteria bacterium]|nr:hypothetical protein [Candidatus Gottesmanbacteria bacterium]